MNYHFKSLTRIAQSLIKCFLILLLFPYLTALPAAGQTTDRTKDLSVKYAAYQAAGQTLKQWEAGDINGIIEACVKENLKKENADRRTSEQNLLEYVKRTLSTRIDEDLKTIAGNFAGNRRDTFFKEMKQTLGPKINNSIQGNLNAKFPSIYKKSRQKAIDVQLDKISGNIYPDPQTDEALLREMETAYKNGWHSQDCSRFKAALEKRLATGETMLEEVRGLKEEIVSGILDDINLQMKTQECGLAKEPPDRCITETQLKNALENQVVTEVNGIRTGTLTITFRMPYNGTSLEVSKEISRVVYAMFDFIRKDMEESAKKKEKSRFKDFCSNEKPKAWTDADLKKSITDDLPTHKDSKTSVRIFTVKYLTEAGMAIIKKYSGKLPPNLRAGMEEKAFKKRLVKYLEDPAFKEILEKRVKASLDNGSGGGDLVRVRKNIAQEQLIKYFPIVNGKTWEVPKLSKPQHMEKKDIMGNIRNKAAKLPKTPREVLEQAQFYELRKRSEGSETLLDNTEDLLLDRVNELITEGGRAWDGQRSIYCYYRDNLERETQLQPGLRHGIKQTIKADPQKSKKELVEQYKTEIRNTWEVKRAQLIWNGAVPPHGHEKYTVLFESIEKEIDRILNTEIEKIKKEIEEEEVKKEEKPIFTEPVEGINDAWPGPGRGPEGPGGGSGGGSGGGIGNGNGPGGGGGGGGGGLAGAGCPELKERLIETQKKLSDTIKQKNRLIWWLIGLGSIVLGGLLAYIFTKMKGKAG